MNEVPVSDPLPIFDNHKNSFPTKLTVGTYIPGIINFATWRDPDSGMIFALGREMLGRGDGVPDPSNSVLLTCDGEGNILSKKLVATPNDCGEQYEDWRADRTKLKTVVLAATWTQRQADGKHLPQLVWTEVPANWDGELTDVHHVSSVGGVKNNTPYHFGTRIMLRRDDCPHQFEDYKITAAGELVHLGDIQMPVYIQNSCLRSGTTFAPRFDQDNRGRAYFHFQEMISGKLVYSIREARVHLEECLRIDQVDMEHVMTRADFSDHVIGELRNEFPIEVVYMTGDRFVNIGDLGSVVLGFPD